MGRLIYNGLVAHLGADLTAGGTTVTFDAALTHSGGTNVPTLSGDYIPLSILDGNAVPSEIVYLTAYTSGATTGTITRAQEGTSGVTHSTGVIVLNAPTVYDNNPLTNTVWAAKGDLLVGTADDTAQVLSSTGATDGQVLTRDVAETPGMKWATPGGAWADWTPTWTNLTVGNGTLNKARYNQNGDTVIVELEFTWGSTTSITASQHVRVSLPVTAAAGAWVLLSYYLDAGTQHYVGNALVGEYTASDAGLHHTTGAGAGNVSNNAPFTWTTGDKIVLTGIFEAA